MFWNFIKIAWRHLTKNPVITIIQIFGLTVGLTVFLLISLWVNNQLSYDRFPEIGDRVYRLELYSPGFNGLTEHEMAPGKIIREEIAEVEKTVRLRYFDNTGILKYAKNEDFENPVTVSHYGNLFADSTFFSVFPFQFIYGDPQKALVDPLSVVIQESISQKLFGEEYPIGEKVIDQNNRVLTVTGVIKDVNNFHIHFEAVKPFHQLKQLYVSSGFEWDSWRFREHPTYVLLRPNVDKKYAESKISSHLINTSQKLFSDMENRHFEQMEYRLRPLSNIYFYGKTEREFSHTQHGNIRLLSGLSLVGLLILILAGINFINLNTTRTFFRTKEIGIRKITGSDRIHLFMQFTGEVVVICVFVFLASLALVYFVLPYYNNLIGTRLAFNELFSSYSLIFVFGSFLLLIIMTGVIPSWLLSACKPVTILQNLAIQNPVKGNFTRKALLSVQYGIAIIVMVITLLVHKQIEYMKNCNPGFNISNVLVYGYPFLRYQNKMEAFKEQLLNHPGIENVSFTMTVPARNFQPSKYSVRFEGKTVDTYGMATFPEYFDVLEIPIVEGRNFISGHKPDYDHRFNNTLRVLLNETAVKEYGLENPVGVTGNIGDVNVEIIGVVKDHHCSSLKSVIPPTIFSYAKAGYKVLIRTTSRNNAKAREHISNTYAELLNSNERQWQGVYLEDIFNSHYKSEEKLGEIFLWFSLFAVLIAGLGLYGVSVNAIQRRVREIGLRKANGASVWDIMKLIQVYFGKIVFWAGILALPLAWYLASRWMMNYPYRTKLSWWIFAGSLLLAILIAVITTGWKTWKAASSNPIEALRFE